MIVPLDTRSVIYAGLSLPKNKLLGPKSSISGFNLTDYGPIRMQILLSFIFLLVISAHARADYFSDIGYDELRAELGVALPVAVDVPVMIVEADKNSDPDVIAYAPDTTKAEFRGKKITVGEHGPTVYAPFSSHATSVGRRFFGLHSSVSPGINLIASYVTGEWYGAAFIRLGETRQPKVTLSRVAAHAWVGSLDVAVDTPANIDALRRVDWLVETDEFFHVVGFNGSDKKPLLADAYNVLTVTHTGAKNFRNTLALDMDYVAGRSLPHLVVPDKSPSASTGRAASAAALLVGVGHAVPSLSQGATVNRRGDKIFNAERAEVIKAILLAGADRITDNSSAENITGYRAAGENRMPNGLDRHYGAGQLNIYNSYQILTAGEQDSTEDKASDDLISPNGFDYDESFGGANDSNRHATYRFSTDSVGGILTLSLVWNIDIQGGLQLLFDPTANLYDLDMVLYDVSNKDPVIVAESRSIRDNSENIHVELAAKRNYMIRINRGVDQSLFDWDYGLAWRFVATDVR